MIKCKQYNLITYYFLQQTKYFIMSFTLFVLKKKNFIYSLPWIPVFMLCISDIKTKYYQLNAYYNCVRMLSFNLGAALISTLILSTTDAHNGHSWLQSLVVQLNAATLFYRSTTFLLLYLTTLDDDSKPTIPSEHWLHTRLWHGVWVLTHTQ